MEVGTIPANSEGRGAPVKLTLLQVRTVDSGHSVEPSTGRHGRVIRSRWTLQQGFGGRAAWVRLHPSLSGYVRVGTESPECPWFEERGTGSGQWKL